MVRNIYLWMVAWTVLAIVAGCSSKSATGTESDFIREFQTADPAIKAKAEHVAAALKTNNYVGAMTTLKEIAASPLSPQQQKAVESMQEMATTQMYAQIEKGDANAIKARDMLQEMRRRPR